MKRWALIRYDQNGAINTITDQEEKPTVFERQGIAEWIDITGTNMCPGFRYIKEENKFEAIPTQTVLTKSELINNFGDAYTEIVIASKTDPVVEVWLEKFRLNSQFNLSDQSVKDQINFLVTKKLLSKSEADRILSL